MDLWLCGENYQGLKNAQAEYVTLLQHFRFKNDIHTTVMPGIVLIYFHFFQVLTCFKVSAYSCTDSFKSLHYGR